MAEYIDRFDQHRCIEFSKSYKDGWYKLTIYTPKKNTSGMTLELPIEAMQELVNNGIKVLEDVHA